MAASARISGQVMEDWSRAKLCDVVNLFWLYGAEMGMSDTGKR